MKRAFLTLGLLVALPAILPGVASAVPGDADGNGTVDGADYLVWSDQYKTSGPEADFNADGIVDGHDYLIWSSHYGQSDPRSGWWVATGGDDNGPGTAAEPFRTIQRAANVATAGDTVTVTAGDYAGWDCPSDGTQGQPIVYQGDEAVVAGGEYGIVIVAGEWIEVSGFEIRDQQKEGIFASDCVGLVIRDCEIFRNGKRQKWDHGVSLFRCFGFVLADLHVYENYAMGVYVKDCEDGSLLRVIANNNTGTDGSDGILLQNSSRIVLDRCQAHNNREDGIDFGGYEDSGHAMSNVIALDCIAMNNGGEGYAISGGGTFRSFGFVLEDCVSVDNAGDGIQLYQGARDITCRRCRFDRNRRGLNVHSGAANILIADGWITDNRVEPYSFNGIPVTLENNEVR